MKKFILHDYKILNNLIKYLEQIDIESELLEVEIKPHKKDRSLAQNRLFHMWMREVSKGYEESHGRTFFPKAWKIHFKEKYLGYDTIETPEGIREELRHTKDLPMKEFSEFLDKIDMYCASELEILLTKPDLYSEAMGR